MTEADEIMLKNNAANMGPTLLDARALLEKMEPVPLCAVCTAGQWYKYADDQLHCFCTKFQGTMYNHNKYPVTACDAYEDASPA
jgi:hypothetical protein